MEELHTTSLVSVIIPSYNRAHVLPKAIESVLSQTYPNWELIIVDDGSTDNTREVVEKIKARDSRIQFIYHEKNQGVSAARNTALALAKGKYVAFLDSDDEWLPEKLEKQVAVFEKSNEVTGLLYTGAFFTDTVHSYVREKHATVEGNILTQELAYNPVGSPSRVMVRKTVFDRVGNFDPTLRALEDWDMWVRIAQKYEIRALDMPLVRYIESSADSLSNDPQKVICGYELFWEKHNILSLPAPIKVMHFLRLGHRLCLLHMLPRGREYFLKAMQVEPTNIKTYILWLLSFLSWKAYKRVTFFITKHIAATI